VLWTALQECGLSIRFQGAFASPCLTPITLSESTLVSSPRLSYHRALGGQTRALGKRRISVPHLDRAKANLEVVLDEACRSLPHGGGHELRAFVAHRLADAVQTGLTTVGELGIVARKALADYKASRSGSSRTLPRMVDLGRSEVDPSRDNDQ
jgi:hypothetical protein